MKIEYGKPYTKNGFRTIETHVDGRYWELRKDCGGGWFATRWQDGKPIHVLPDVRIFGLREAKKWLERMVQNDKQ